MSSVLELQAQDRVSWVAPFGVQFCDAVTHAPIRMGLEVLILLRDQPQQQMRAHANSSGIMLAHRLPGMAARTLVTHSLSKTYSITGWRLGYVQASAEVIAQARKDGIPEAWIQGAQQSPIYKMAVQWKVALPLHPEYGTEPNIYYVPPLGSRAFGADGEITDQSRIPLATLEEMFGPEVSRVLGVLRAEREKSKQGQKSELIDLLVSKVWSDRLGGFTASPLSQFEGTEVTPTVTTSSPTTTTQGGAK